MVAVQLVIKNPAATSVVHSIVVDTQTSILELKTRLSVEYPGNPAPSTQKLIFSGRLLQDADLISDILTQHDINSPQTFHIVVASPARQQTPQPSTSTSTTPTPTTSTTPSPTIIGNHQQIPQSSTPTAVPIASTQSPTAVAARAVQGYYGSPNPVNDQTYAALYPGITPQQQQQFILQQQQAYQLYAQQYAQYQAQLQAHAQYQAQTQAQAQGQQPFAPPAQQQQQQPAQVQPQPQVQGQPQPVAAIEFRINLGLMFKLCVLVFILSQGGSVERTALIIAGAFALYLYLSTRPPPGPDAPEVPVEPQAGIFYELQDFFLPLILSLLPTWTPPPRVAAPLPMPPNPVATPDANPAEPNENANEVAM